MRDRTTYPGVPAELRTYVRTEFRGDGAEVRRMLAQAAETARSKPSAPSRRGVLSTLFEALGAAFARPGGA
jgi:hypothetical protein